MIEMPDDNPFTEEVEQFCWRDSGRQCGGECVAYDDRCEVDPIWSPCLLINIKRAKAKSLANLSVETKRFNDRFVQDEEQVKRLEKLRATEAYARKVKEMDAPPPEIKT